MNHMIRGYSESTDELCDERDLELPSSVWRALVGVPEDDPEAVDCYPIPLQYAPIFDLNPDEMEGMEYFIEPE